MKDKIKRGTCILSEKPFVYCLHSKYRRERCDFCLLASKLMKCAKCEYVYYCNRSCQVNAWPVHKMECEYLKNVGNRNIPDSARMLSRIILKLTNGGAAEKSYYTKDQFRKFDDMMSHYDELKDDSKRMEHLESLEVVLKSILGNKLVPNTEKLLGLYGRLLTNSFNILDPEMNSFATGLYLAVSVTDHSCAPNAVATFEGTTLKIHLTEDMPCLDWSKIFISYIDLLNTTEYRRNLLQKNYYFLCICNKCLDTQEPIEMAAASCPNKSCNESLNIENAKCPKCLTTISNEFRQQYHEVMLLTRNHLDSMKDNAYLDICKICLNKHKNVLHPMNLWHIQTLDCAFDSAIQINNWADALIYGPRLIIGVKKYCGEFNPLLGILYMKLGKIQLLCGYSKEGEYSLLEALKILQITHGTDSIFYKDELIPLLQSCYFSSS